MEYPDDAPGSRQTASRPNIKKEVQRLHLPMTNGRLSPQEATGFVDTRFTGSVNRQNKQVSWLADLRCPTPSHAYAQWQTVEPLPVHSDRIARDFHPVPF